MPNERPKTGETQPADAIRRHLGGALDSFIASLLATIRPPAPALQPVAITTRRRRQRLPK